MDEFGQQGTEAQKEPTFQTTPRPPTFPSESKPKANIGIVILLIVLVVAVGAGWFLLRGPSETPSPSPSPTIAGAVSTPTPSPTPAVDKDKIKIKVLNGTGITGEASYLQGQLRSLGYKNVEVGNQDRKDVETTIVTFSKSAPQAIIDEITDKLKALYKEVETKTGSSTSFDAEIVTGLRKGQTPKPSPTATPSPSASPTASPAPSPSPT